MNDISFYSNEGEANQNSRKIVKLHTFETYSFGYFRSLNNLFRLSIYYKHYVQQYIRSGCFSCGDGIWSASAGILCYIFIRWSEMVG